MLAHSPLPSSDHVLRRGINGGRTCLDDSHRQLHLKFLPDQLLLDLVEMSGLHPRARREAASPAGRHYTRRECHIE